MTIDVEGCAFYHPEYNEDCHIGLVFANEYTGGGCTYFKCEQNPNCHYKQYYRAVGKLRRIEKLCTDCQMNEYDVGTCSLCSHDKECWTEHGEIPTYDVTQPILEIINEKEEMRTVN